MYKQIISSLIFLSFILPGVAAGQGFNSVQINGGVIAPVHAYNGFTGSVQLNYPVNQILSFYAYTGYSSWDRNKIIFSQELNWPQTQQYLDTYSADGHMLIPLYIGSKINFRTYKQFTSFIEAEIGYSYLNYNQYGSIKKVSAETGQVLAYYPDINSKQKIDENLFGIGLGLGVSHHLWKKVSLVLTFKVNSFLNSKYHGLFSSNGTYTSFIAGFDFNI